MSAYICDRYHISALAAYATAHPSAYVYHNNTHHDLIDPELVADILYQQNLRSVNERYHEHEEGVFEFDEHARYATHTPVAILKACHCYDYQACETDDYNTTLAKAITRLPGYEAAEWRLTRPATKTVSIFSLTQK